MKVFFLLFISNLIFIDRNIIPTAVSVNKDNGYGLIEK